MALVSNILTQLFITLIAVAGVYVLTGLTGMFSLGQAAFMAVGAYASGLLVIKAHVPFVPAVILAVVMAVAVGYLIGFPAVRLRRDYISLVTLGFGEAIAALLNRMTSLTGGASDLTGIPARRLCSSPRCRRLLPSCWWRSSKRASTGASAWPSAATSWRPRPWASTSRASR